MMVASLKGPTLNLGSPATRLAPALLELTRAVLLQDRHYVERVKRHYQLFREQIEGGPVRQGTVASRKANSKTDTAFAPATDESAESDHVLMTVGARANTRRVARLGVARQRTG
jgi:hypothetical protein